MRWWIVSVFCAVLMGHGCLASRILGVFPVGSKSHWAVGSSVLMALGEAGHEVTVISPFLMPNSSTALYKTIHIHEIEDLSKLASTTFVTNWWMRIPGLAQLGLLGFGKSLVEATMENAAVKQLMADKSKQFDLIVIEPFAIDTLFGFIEHFKAPAVGVFTASPMKRVNELVGNPEELSYIPNLLLPFSNQMNVFQRIQNYQMAFWDHLVFTKLSLFVHDGLHKKYFPNNKKSLDKIMAEDVALTFINTHFSLSFPRPYVPNMIEIGGINIDRKIGELPAKYKNFLDNAEHGVILFSMGSIFQASDFTPDQRAALISVLGKLKQKVIWRYNLPDADQLPKNILTSQWLPQKEIMAHPNVKLFITHGGMLGTTEGLYHGKPMVGIPVMADQHLNIARATTRGYAVRLNMNSLTESTISAAVNEILYNGSYSQRAQELSAIYRDQPMTPQELVVYWSEYVMRHKGAKHMRVEGINQCFFTRNGLDVLLILAILVLAPNYFIIKCIIGKFSKKSAGSKPNSKKVKVK